jgi:hypothetical protein
MGIWEKGRREQLENGPIMFDLARGGIAFLVHPEHDPPDAPRAKRHEHAVPTLKGHPIGNGVGKAVQPTRETRGKTHESQPHRGRRNSATRNPTPNGASYE